jgi:hypothetical protein
MKNLYFLITVFTLTIVLLTSCKKRDFEAISKPNIDIQRILRLGFDTSGIVDMGNYYIVEGDIMIKKVQFSALPRQVYNANSGLLSITHQSNITVRVDSTIPTDGGNLDWRNEVSQAIQEYNSLTNSNIRLSQTSAIPADITITSRVLFDQFGRDFSVIAAAEWPNNGQPGSLITLNAHYDQGSPVSTSQKKYNLVHELGHNIGFRHTNWYGLNEPPGTLVGSSPNSGTNPDPSSVFNGGTATHTWQGFSSWDIYAINYLYPTRKPLIYGMIDGANLGGLEDVTIVNTASGSGSIQAPPGTIVKLRVVVYTGSLFAQLHFVLSGATVTGARGNDITVTDWNYPTQTFTMPPSGNVSWTADYYEVPNNSGVGEFNVSL